MLWKYCYKQLKLYTHTQTRKKCVDLFLPTSFLHMSFSGTYFAWTSAVVLWRCPLRTILDQGTEKRVRETDLDCKEVRVNEAFHFDSGSGSRWLRRKCVLVDCHDEISDWWQWPHSIDLIFRFFQLFHGLFSRPTRN